MGSTGRRKQCVPRPQSVSFSNCGLTDSSRQLAEGGPVGEELAGQVGYFGIFDGYVRAKDFTQPHANHASHLFANRHGGQHVAQYLHERLHAMIEEVSKSSIDDVVQFHKKLGEPRRSSSIDYTESKQFLSFRWLFQTIQGRRITAMGPSSGLSRQVDTRRTNHAHVSPSTLVRLPYVCRDPVKLILLRIGGPTRAFSRRHKAMRIHSVRRTCTFP